MIYYWQILKYFLEKKINPVNTVLKRPEVDDDISNSDQIIPTAGLQVKRKDIIQDGLESFPDEAFNVNNIY